MHKDDIPSLLVALDNEKNENIMNLDNKKIEYIKNDILQQLNLPEVELKQIKRKLNGYRYIDELTDINYGSYIRWIKLLDPTKIKLSNGGIICDIQVHEDGIHIVCKNNINKFMQIRLSENLVFQKMTDQENILLSVMDHLNSNS